MATPGYTEELQSSQPQGGSVTTVKSGQQKASPTVAPAFLSDIQSSSGSSPSQAGLSSRMTQTTPPTILKKAVLATPTQVTAAATQYAVSEIQSSASGSSNGQNTPQYIVVTVSGEMYTHCTTGHSSRFRNTHCASSCFLYFLSELPAAAWSSLLLLLSGIMKCVCVESVATLQVYLWLFLLAESRRKCPTSHITPNPATTPYIP